MLINLSDNSKTINIYDRKQYQEVKYKYTIL